MPLRAGRRSSRRPRARRSATGSPARSDRRRVPPARLSQLGEAAPITRSSSADPVASATCRSHDRPTRRALRHLLRVRHRSSSLCGATAWSGNHDDQYLSWRAPHSSREARPWSSHCSLLSALASISSSRCSPGGPSSMIASVELLDPSHHHLVGRIRRRRSSPVRRSSPRLFGSSWRWRRTRATYRRRRVGRGPGTRESNTEC